jgi:hypothetical protein
MPGPFPSDFQTNVCTCHLSQSCCLPQTNANNSRGYHSSNTHSHFCNTPVIHSPFLHVTPWETFGLSGVPCLLSFRCFTELISCWITYVSQKTAAPNRIDMVFWMQQNILYFREQTQS